MPRGLFLQRGATVGGVSRECVAPVLLRAIALAGMVVPKWGQDRRRRVRYQFKLTTQNWGVTWCDEPSAGLERVVNSHRAGAALIRLGFPGSEAAHEYNIVGPPAKVALNSSGETYC